MRPGRTVRLSTAETPPPNTDIVLAPGQLRPLERKLSEYRMRHLDDGAPVIEPLDDLTLRAHGFHPVNELFKRTVLGIVLDLVQQNRRGTPDKPITIDQVGWHIGDVLGIDVSDAIEGPNAIPFIYEPDADWSFPVLSKPVIRAASLGEVFVGAYGVIRAYAHNRLDVLDGGTGLMTIGPTRPDPRN